MPRREERPEEWFNRFDEMFDGANRVAQLGLGVIFQAWMLFSLLQLSLKQWCKMLKDLQHRLPRDRAEHVELQQITLREETLEGSISDLRSNARNVLGSDGGRGDGSYLSSDGCAEPRPFQRSEGWQVQWGEVLPLP